MLGRDELYSGPVVAETWPDQGLEPDVGSGSDQRLQMPYIPTDAHALLSSFPGSTQIAEKR